MRELYNKSMEYSEIVVDENITLRGLREDEAETLYALTESNREYLAKWLPWVDLTKSPDDSRSFIASTIENRSKGSEYGFGLIFEDQIAGHMSLMHITDDKAPEIGYWITSSVSGKGITTKAANTLTIFGLKTLGLDKIVIKADPNNIASNTIAENLGYRLAKQEQDPVNGLMNVWEITQKDY